MEFLWHTLILVIRIKHGWKTMDLIMDELENTGISNPCIHQSHSYPVCHISNFSCPWLVNSPSKYFPFIGERIKYLENQSKNSMPYFISFLSWNTWLGGGSGAFPTREEGHLWGYWPEVGKGPSATYALLDNEESFLFPQGAVAVPFDSKDKEFITKG